MTDNEIFLAAMATVGAALAIQSYRQKSRLQKEKIQLSKDLTQQQVAYEKLKSETLKFQLTSHAFDNVLVVLSNCIFRIFFYIPRF